MSFSPTPTAGGLDAVRAQCWKQARERILGGRSPQKEHGKMRRAQVAAAARADEAFAAGDVSAARKAVANVVPLGNELLLECACRAGQWDFATKLAATGLDATAAVVDHSALYFACVAGNVEFVRTVIAALGPDADDLCYSFDQRIGTDDFVAVAREHGHDGIAAMIEEYNDE